MFFKGFLYATHNEVHVLTGRDSALLTESSDGGSAALSGTSLQGQGLRSVLDLGHGSDSLVLGLGVLFDLALDLLGGLDLTGVGNGATDNGGHSQGGRDALEVDHIE